MSEGALVDNQGIHFAHQNSVKNHKSRMWLIWMNGISIAAGADFYIAMTTGNVPMELITYTVTTDSVETVADFYEGGTFSGGTVLQSNNLNRENPVALPAAGGGQGVTIDTLGVLVFPKVLRNSSNIFGENAIVGGANDVSIIMAANQTYYFHIKNSDASTRLYDGAWTVALHDH